MMKTKSKSKPVGVRKSYSPTAVIKAKRAISLGLSKQEAARKYGVPRTTLLFRIAKENTNKQKKIPGPATILTQEEEKLLEDWILHCAKKGFPRRKLDIALSIKEFLELNPRKNTFKNNMPSRGWFKRFLGRHPELSERRSESVSSASANVSEKHIRTWFKKVKEVLLEEANLDILKDPTRVFNGDETGFVLNPLTGTKVIAKKGSKNVYEVEKGASKTSVTVMFTFSANGKLLVPPMIIFPYKRMPDEVLKSVPSNWGVGRSDSGWMKAEVFYEYIANVFHPFLEEKKIKRPVILFVDGHKSHLTYQLSSLCTELEIIMIALYPNATRILQPADVACFKPLKNAWKFAVCDWARVNPGQEINFRTFAPILKIAIEKFVNSETIKKGFKACGLCPWDENAIDYTKCLASQPNNNDSVEDNEHDFIAADSNGNRTELLSYDEFVNLVGSDLIEKIRENSSDCSKDDCIQGIKNILKYFASNDESPMLHESVIENNDVVKVPENLEATGPENLEVTGPENLVATSETEVLNAHPTTTEDVENIDTENLVNVEEPCTSSQAIKRCLFPESNNQSSSTALKNILHWPESPKKKRPTQNQDFLPYVTTCQLWKDIKIKKVVQKKKQEEEKEIRKKIRAEKKEKAKAAKKGAVKGVCSKCNGKIYRSKFFECSMCTKVFHERCLPKNFEENIPDSGDEDKFVCHQCLDLEESDNESDNSST